MRIEPPSLDIPLERKERWGLTLIGACTAAVGFAAIINPGFAIVFAAACIVGLPVLWLFFFPPHLAATYLQKSDFRRFGVYLFLFGYLALSKKILVPFVAGLIEHVLK